MPPKKIAKAKKGGESEMAPVVVGDEEENGVEEVNTEETEEDEDKLPKQRGVKRVGVTKKKAPPTKKTKSSPPKGKTADVDKSTKKGTKKTEDVQEEEQTEGNEEEEEEENVEKVEKKKSGKKPGTHKSKGDRQENGAVVGTRPKREAFQKAVEKVATNKHKVTKNKTKQKKTEC